MPKGGNAHPYELKQKSTLELSRRRLDFSLENQYEGPYQDLYEAFEFAELINDSRLYSDFVFYPVSTTDGFIVVQDYKQ